MSETKLISDDAKVVLPMMANLLGIDTSPKPKPKWMPKWIWNLKKRRKEENALMQWKPVEPHPVIVRMQIAQELRDFAEMIVGHSHIDPEKSVIRRSNREVNGNVWMRHFKYTPPKVKKLNERGLRRMARKAIRETNKKLAEMDITVAGDNEIDPEVDMDQRENE